MKICSRCQEPLPIIYFSKDRGTSSGLNNWCKSCCAIVFRKWSKSEIGLIRGIYKHQKRSSRDRGHLPPTYTLEELIDWMLSQPNFEELYRGWIKSKYNKWKAPSVDRLNDDLGYSFDNIRLVSFEENKKAYDNKKINGEVICDLKPISVYNCLGFKLASYYSLNELKRQTGIEITYISKLINSEAPFYRDNIYIYDEDFSEEILDKYIYQNFYSKYKNAVCQIDKVSGKVIQIYSSCRDAHINLNISIKSDAISRAVRRGSISRGFRWELYLKHFNFRNPDETL